MEQLHAHEVLHMMEGNSYTEASLKEAIVEKFGKDQLFYACSAENMNVDALIEFLKQKGKFMPLNDGFTVDVLKSTVPNTNTSRALFWKSIRTPPEKS